jgi:hypothetical protein
MLAYCKELLEDQNWHIWWSPPNMPSWLHALVQQPRKVTVRWTEATSHDDCLMHSDYRLCSGIEK